MGLLIGFIAAIIAAIVYLVYKDHPGSSLVATWIKAVSLYLAIISVCILIVLLTIGCQYLIML